MRSGNGSSLQDIVLLFMQCFLFILLWCKSDEINDSLFLIKISIVFVLKSMSYMTVLKVCGRCSSDRTFGRRVGEVLGGT